MKKKLNLAVVLFLSVFLMCGCSAGNMGKALLNTVMGMGTVFVMLIIIAFIISLFKYISKAESWFNNRGKKTQSEATAYQMPEAEDTEETDDTEDIDDLELVAVITAALAASLGTSPDGLVVRSIRRKNSNRW